MSTPSVLRARVFVSCGQRDNSGETEIAEKIGQELRSLGFDPWIAFRAQSLRTIRENVFPRLNDFEYFLFVDFKRDPLWPDSITQRLKHCFLGHDGLECRGSLFSHQELAIASFLEKPIIAFQERGTKQRDGLIGHLQTNCTPFEDRATLVDLVISRVKADWNATWLNRLEISIHTPILGPSTLRQPEDEYARFSHLVIRNRHEKKTAQECYGYLRSVKNLSTNEYVPFETAELKWAGYMFPFARIAPSSSRRLDAFFIFEKYPLNPFFNCLTDSTEFVPRFQGKGKWLINYEVVSANIPGSTFSMILNLTESLDSLTLTPA